ncbi:hypothetical protein KCX80_16915 [Paenibacillus mucilaginosus]|nr:hypothetical protein KCX80_16915 [Paenibacillus mucilaginosus]
MRRRMTRWTITTGAAVLTALLLTGCGQQALQDLKEAAAREAAASNQASDQAFEQASDPPKSVSPEVLESLLRKHDGLQSVFRQHGVRPLGSGMNERGAYLEVRRIGEHDRTLTEREIEAFRQSVYKAAGGRFPLKITVRTLAAQPDMTGRVTAIDGEGRLLIVSTDRFLEQERTRPDAAWYRMADDAEMTADGRRLQAAEIPIGSAVQAWSEGMMLTSYPGQTTGLRLVVKAPDTETGDAQGTVTGLSMSGEGVNAMHTIGINGVTYRLLASARVWEKGGQVGFSELKEGRRAKVWFSGLEIGERKTVSQIVLLDGE